MSGQRRTTRWLSPALALVIGVTFGAPPAAASPSPRPITSAAAARVAALPHVALAQVATPATAPAPDKPFLKTGKGVLALSLLAGALGYTAYSLSHDRVKSPLR